MRYYNDRTVYERFNNPFTVECGSPFLNLLPMIVDDSPPPKKIYRYTTDTIPASIYFASVKYISNFTTSFDYTNVIVLASDDTNTPHTIMRYNPGSFRRKTGYYFRLHDGIRCYKKRVILLQMFY